MIGSQPASQGGGAHADVHDRESVVANLRELGIGNDETQTRPKRRNATLILTLVLLATGAAALLVLRTGVEAVQVQVETIRTSVSADNSGALDISGNIVAKTTATVSSNVTGLIREIYVDVGSRVEAGEPVASLDDRRVRIQLEIDRLDLVSSIAAHQVTMAELELARLELGRAEALADSLAMSPQQLDQLKNRFSVATAEVAMAAATVDRLRAQIQLREQTLDDLVIRAPFAGIVTNLAANVGEVISPSSAGGGFTRTGICTIVSDSNLEFEFQINERQLHRIHLGGIVKISLPAIPGQEFVGEVVRLDPAADPQTGTVRAYVELPDILPQMKPGSRVSGLFMPPENPDTAARTVLPSSALHVEGDQSFVFVVRDGLAHKLGVEVESVNANDDIVLQEDWQVPQTVIIGSEGQLYDRTPVKW